MSRLNPASRRSRAVRRPASALAALLGAVLAAILPAAPASAAVSFGKSLLAGASSDRPTSLQFGPDGRLYVAQQNGLIKAYTIARSGANAYAVTATEAIPHIQSIPNHNDSGGADATAGRLVTGLLVTGTAAAPVVYVTSSDPRIGAGPDATDLDLDTNSGILSRLDRSGGGWIKTDLVRGLPRSEENHAPNGMALSLDKKTLYIAQGGNTNRGAPSPNFANLPEYPLSAAILAVNLAGTPIDLPGGSNGPFGGKDGATPAQPSGPVSVYAPGFRNSYDVLVTQAGRMYTIDNGGNAGWGDPLTSCASAGGQANSVSEPDVLHHVTGPGYYGGHPNPSRGQCTYQTAVASQPFPSKTHIASFGPTSTNGLDEYTASNFGGELRGDLLATSWNNTIQRLKLNPQGTAVVAKSALVTTASSGNPLDITTQGDAEIFPGTVWYVDIVGNTITVLEPGDCDLSLVDADGDGFPNAVEEAAGTGPCSAADQPPDRDGDKLPDATDPDDDNDGLADPVDPFALDAANGLATRLPAIFPWENDAGPAGGILGLGFTGLMTNGTANYLELFDPAKMTAVGAAGAVTVDEAGEGDALGTTNTQKYGFQLGVNAAPKTGPFTVHTRVLSPFAGLAPQDFQSMGLFFGTGDQDNYVKLTTATGGVEALREVEAKTAKSRQPLALPGPQAVDLYLSVDPEKGTVQPSYTATVGGGTSERVAAGPKLRVPKEWFTACTGVAVGILSTSAGPAPTFPATWDLLEVTPDSGAAPPESPTVRCSPTPNPADRWAPRISRLAMPARVRGAMRGTTISARRKVPVRYRLSEGARVRYVVQRAREGRRRGGRCVAPGRAKAGARSCERYVKVRGGAQRRHAAGRVSVRFRGRAAGRRLAKGRYRLKVRATDVSGNRSKRAYEKFRVVR